MKTTPYEDVNEVLATLERGIVNIFSSNLIGVYLAGSLSYGDFMPGRSDIDLVIVIKNPASKKEIERVEQLHGRVAVQHEKWAERLECSYIDMAMLGEIMPPKAPRPYYGGGTFYPEAPFGNEWIINQYLLYRYGINLIGPNFKDLAQPIEITEVQKACIRDLSVEWEPKINDPGWVENSHQQSYLVLNLCRILYTVLYGALGSKVVSAEWVKGKFSEWTDLIEAAENWKYGTELELNERTIEFLRFVMKKVDEKPLEDL